MAEFAPVAPIALLRQLDKAGVAGHYHLLLAHEVQRSPYAHQNFWETEDHRDDAVILDNSVIELGVPMPLGVMLALKGLLPQNTVLVLPDIIGDSHETLMWAKAVLSSAKSSGPAGFLGVAQGSTIDQVWDCAVKMYHDLGLRYISVPRHLTTKLGTRTEITQAILNELPEVKLHLLGFSDDILDDMQSATIPGVLGIDSAVPVWAADPLTSMSFPGKRPVNFMDWTELPMHAVDNVKRVRAWLNDAKDVPTKGTLAGQGEISQVRSSS